jgi:hypothetical protein
MSVDVVCAGAPFLDITFSGMGAMPALGEERMAERVQFTPGGLANVALGLTRLDLEAVVMSPVGDDLCGRILSGLLAEQGIGWVGPRADATAVSAILPLDGDRAFVTVAPDLPRDGEAIAALEPRAVVIDLPEVAEAPTGCAVYAVVGDFDARALAGRLPAALADQEYVRRYVAQVVWSRNRLEKEFGVRGIPFWPSQANFVLARIGPSHADFVQGMRARGILVRDRSSDFGCDGCVRITAGWQEHTERMLNALDETLKEIGWGERKPA